MSAAFTIRGNDNYILPTPGAENKLAGASTWPLKSKRIRDRRMENYNVSDPLDQRFVPMGPNRPTQPQSGRNHHRQGQPHRPALDFGLDLVGLDLWQVKLAVTDGLVVDLLAMLPGPLPPTFDRALIQAIGRHNRLPGTTISQQSQHDDHQLSLVLEPIKDRPLL